MIYEQNPNLKRPRIRNGSVKFRPQISQVAIVADQVPAVPQQPCNVITPCNDVEMTPVQTESSDDVETIVEDIIKDSDIVKSVLDMGFEVDVIRKTLAKTLTEDRTLKFESRFQLVDAVLKFESS